ncbi:hypothetical protein OQA88_9432 [Cercophora sp. LCS_1]
MSFPLRKPKTWPYAASSTGRLRGSLPLGVLGFRLQVYEATGHARRIYVDLSKDIVDYLDANASDTRASSSYVGLSLFMVGRAPEKTKPMVMIVSEDKNARVEAFRLVNKSGILAKYPGFEVGHMPLRAEFENLQPLRDAAGPRAQGAPSDFEDEDESEESDFEFDVFTPMTDLKTEGRSLRAWRGNGVGSGEMQSATAGGLVECNGEYYFQTVAHFLKPPTAKTLAGTSDSGDEWDATGLSDFEEDGDDDLVQATSRGSWTPDGDSSASEASSDADILDSTPRSRTSSSRAFPQPRDPPPSAGTPETPETLIKIGRVALLSDAHDSAFIHLDANLPTQLRLSRARMRVDALHLEGFTESIEKRPADTTIKTTTSRGNLTGTLSGSLSYFRLPHAATFQKVYTGKLERPLAPGDSGSWVRNTVTGKLLGHIIAGSPTTRLHTPRMLSTARNVHDRANPIANSIHYCQTTSRQSLNVSWVTVPPVGNWEEDRATTRTISQPPTDGDQAHETRTGIRWSQ